LTFSLDESKLQIME